MARNVSADNASRPKSREDADRDVTSYFTRVHDSQIHTKALARTSLFSGLSERELGLVLERVVARKYASGEAVFSEDEPGAGF